MTDPTTPETPDLVARLRALFGKAQCIPWRLESVIRGNEVVRDQIMSAAECEVVFDVHSAEDGALIVEAVNALPILLDALERMAGENARLEQAVRIVQNAAKTIMSTHGTELEHLRQNATFDHRLRAEHESLQARDAMMTDALLAAEAERDRYKAALEAIARWDMPPTGEFWRNSDGSLSDRPMSYGAVNGSNGEQRYVRSSASAALGSAGVD